MERFLKGEGTYSNVWWLKITRRHSGFCEGTMFQVWLSGVGELLQPKGVTRLVLYSLETQPFPFNLISAI